MSQKLRIIVYNNSELEENELVRYPVAVRLQNLAWIACFWQGRFLKNRNFSLIHLILWTI